MHGENRDFEVEYKLRESLESLLDGIWEKIYISMKNRNMVYVQGNE